MAWQTKQMTPLLQSKRKPFPLLHFYGCLILFLVQMRLLFHLPTKEQRPDQLTHVRAHAHDVLGSGAP